MFCRGFPIISFVYRFTTKHLGTSQTVTRTPWVSRPISACSARNWLSVPKWLWKGIHSLLHPPLDRTESNFMSSQKGKNFFFNRHSTTTIKKKEKGENIYSRLSKEKWFGVGRKSGLAFHAYGYTNLDSDGFPFTKYFLLPFRLTDFCSLFLILSNVRSSWIRFLIVNYDPRLNIYLYTYNGTWRRRRDRSRWFLVQKLRTRGVINSEREFF